MTGATGDETEANVLRLCFKALNPLRGDIVTQLKLNFKAPCGAVCVYPARVEDAVKVLHRANSKLPVASGKEKLQLTKLIHADADLWIFQSQPGSQPDRPA